jgi:hypothetical protein
MQGSDGAPVQLLVGFGHEKPISLQRPEVAREKLPSLVVAGGAARWQPSRPMAPLSQMAGGNRAKKKQAPPPAVSWSTMKLVEHARVSRCALELKTMMMMLPLKRPMFVWRWPCQPTSSLAQQQQLLKTTTTRRS